MPRKSDSRARWGTTPEPLMLKFRVVVLRRMRKSEVVQKLKEAVRRGVVPEGIEIRYMDWSKGREGELREGRIDQARLTELQAFYRALAQSDIRGERVE